MTVVEISPELLLLAEASGVGMVHVTTVHAVNAVVVSISVGVGVGPLCDIYRVAFGYIRYDVFVYDIMIICTNEAIINDPINMPRYQYFDRCPPALTTKQTSTGLYEGCLLRTTCFQPAIYSALRSCSVNLMCI